MKHDYKPGRLHPLEEGLRGAGETACGAVLIGLGIFVRGTECLVVPGAVAFGDGLRRIDIAINDPLWNSNGRANL